MVLGRARRCRRRDPAGIYSGAQPRPQHIATPGLPAHRRTQRLLFAAAGHSCAELEHVTGGGDSRGDAPGSRAIPAEDRLALDAGIRALPPEQREVIHLHVFEGLTFKEVAETTGQPPNTVPSRYSTRWRNCAPAFWDCHDGRRARSAAAGRAAERPVGGVARPNPRASSVQAVQAGQATKRAWPWAVAAAALLGFTFLLQTASAGLRHRVREANAVAAPDIENELTIALRESGLSEEDARLIAMVHQVQMRIEQNRPAAERPEP